MNNFVVLVDYAQLDSLPRDNREREYQAQHSRIEELVEKNEEKSKIIENLSTQNAELENKIKQKEEKFLELQEQSKKLIKRNNTRNKKSCLRRNKKILELRKSSDSEKNDVEVEKIKQELNQSTVKIELKRSDTEKDELKKILSEKEEVIFSQNQTIKRKNLNLKVLLDQIHKTCTKRG